MQLRESIAPGDLLFFSPPRPLVPFHKKLLLYQAFLSCLLCYYNTQDYQKSHVAICTANNGDFITLAHIGGTGNFVNEPMTDYLGDRLVAVLRPKEGHFASILAHIASRPSNNDEITFSKRSFWTVFPCASSRQNISLTTDEFSRETHCSRFIYEAINLAAKKSSKPERYQINASGNISVSRLWQRLISSDSYVDLQSKKREFKTPAAETPKFDSTPLLQSMA